MKKLRLPWMSERLLPVFGALLLGCSLTNNGSNDAGNDGADDAADDDGGTGGTAGGSADGSSDGMSGVVQDVTIYDIQQGKVAPEALVRLTEVVVTSPVHVEKSGVFVQEQEGGEFSGLYLYLYSEIVDTAELAPGDVINIVGTYSEFYDQSQLTVKNVQDVEIVGQAQVPAPVVVEASAIAGDAEVAESFESVLVKIENVTVEDADPGHGDFSVDGGLLVNGFFLGAELPRPPAGKVIESITGPLLYNFEKFKIAPRSVEDLVGAEVDPVTASISEIQQGEVTAGTPVIVENVVVTSPYNFDGDLFFVQEPEGGPWSGIGVFLTGAVAMAAPELAVGDVVTVRGIYEEYFDLSEIKVTAVEGIEVTGSGDVPAPAVVSPEDVATNGEQQEAYEGVLVTVENVTVSTEADSYGAWAVGDLLVDDTFFGTDAGWPEPSVGQLYEVITGIMSFDHSEARLLPRTLDDLTEGTAEE